MVGREIVVNGHAFTVVGVTAPEFTGTEISDNPPQLFLPLAMYAWAAPSWPNPYADQTAWLFRAMGRLAPGATVARAETELTALASRLKREDPADRGAVGLRVTPVRGRVHEQDQGDVTGLAAIGLGVSIIVLLVACANVANLLLGRAASRRREVGIRLALGAPRKRLIRQLLTESLLLASIAGLTSLLLSAWVTDALVGLVGLPFTLDLEPDLRVLAAALLASVVASVAFGLVPALVASAEAVGPALSDGSPGAGRPRRARLQRLLVVSEVALSLVLVVSAGLLLRSLSIASGLQRGFDTNDRVLAASLDIGAQGYSAEGRVNFVRGLLEAVFAVPGVQHASVARLVPMGGRMWSTWLSPEGGALPEAGRPPMVSLNNVWPGFFQTIGMPLAAGRDFAADDRDGAPRVAIVNQQLARTFWPGQNPIGRRLRFGVDDDFGEWMTVVGVAQDATYDEDGEEVQPFLYIPWLQAGSLGEPVSLLVRVGGDGASVVAALRGIVRRMDASLPLYDVTTMGEVIRNRQAPRRAASVVLNIFGGLALVIAAVGLYGVMAFVVAERRREIRRAGRPRSDQRSRDAPGGRRGAAAGGGRDGGRGADVGGCHARARRRTGGRLAARPAHLRRRDRRVGHVGARCLLPAGASGDAGGSGAIAQGGVGRVGGEASASGAPSGQTRSMAASRAAGRTGFET